MSTCPDHELFSAYCDGEVPSPWKEKLERHVAGCPECKKLTDRHASLSARLREGSPTLTREALDASFARLQARRSLTEGRTADSGRAEWFRTTVRLPLPALAAMFLAAIILPSALTLSSRDGKADDVHLASMPLRQMISPASELPRLPVASYPVISDDLPELAVRWSDTSSRDSALFTMVNYAQRFATDQDLIGDAEIVIIKLPNLTRFSAGSDYPMASGTDTVNDGRMTLVRNPGK